MDRVLSNLTFDPTVDSIVTPGQAVEFQVSVTLTSRIQGSLKVQFGDGDTHVSQLEDTNSTSFALRCDQGEMTVASSYGNGCNLLIEFKHSFLKEGTYVPRAFITSENLTLTSDISRPVIVMNELSGGRLQCEKAVAVNKTLDILLLLSTRSDAMEVTWVIKSTSDEVLLNTTNADLRFSFAFSHPGLYSISAIAKNQISRVTAVSSVRVLQSIINVYLSCGQAQFISSGEVIECTADLLDGTDPKFVWNFQDSSLPRQPIQVKTRDLSSIANYSYQTPGQYNISVTANNSISTSTAYVPRLIHVLDPVSCVAVQSAGPTPLGSTMNFMVTVCGGTNVQLEFNFGHSRRNYRYTHGETSWVFYSNFTFNKPGIHDVTVYAFNRVSEVTHTTQVLVQELLPRKLEFRVLNERQVVETPVSMIVTYEGKRFYCPPPFAKEGGGGH